jgi:glucose dehydrogenase
MMARMGDNLVATTFVAMRLFFLLGILATSLQAQTVRPTPAAQSRPVNTGDWSTVSGDPGANRFSPLTQISRSNVGSLKVLWTFATGSLRAHEGNPLVAGGRLFLHTPHPVAVYAFDLDRTWRPTALEVRAHQSRSRPLRLLRWRGARDRLAPERKALRAALSR